MTSTRTSSAAADGVGVVSFVAALVLVLAFPHAELAQSDPMIGVWKLNLAKSTYNPGPPPKSQTTTFAAVGTGGIKNTTEGIAADGSRIAYSVTNNYDGKEYRYSGVGTPNGADAIASKRIDPYTIESTSTKAGKVVQTSRTVFSKDGKLRTVTSRGTNASGQPTNNVSVYDRQ